MFVINVTDIDDKIIARAKEEGVSVKELARRWEEAFCKKFSSMNLLLTVCVATVGCVSAEQLQRPAQIVFCGSSSIRMCQVHLSGRHSGPRAQTNDRHPAATS